MKLVCNKYYLDSFAVNNVHHYSLCCTIYFHNDFIPHLKENFKTTIIKI